MVDFIIFKEQNMDHYPCQNRVDKLERQKRQQTGGGFAAQAKREDINKGYLRVSQRRVKVKVK